MKTSENENMTVQNLWDTAKGVLRGKYIAIQAFLKKQKRSPIHNLSLHLKELEKEKQRKPKPRTRREIKIRSEINKIEIKKTIEQINKTRRWFFERINKIDKSLARLIKKKRERTQINKIMMEEERSQPIPKKYKQLEEHIMSNYTPANLTIWKKCMPS